MTHTQLPQEIPKAAHHQALDQAQATLAETEVLYRTSRSLIAVESLPQGVNFGIALPTAPSGKEQEVGR
jgi:hypothetical protein